MTDPSAPSAAMLARAVPFLRAVVAPHADALAGWLRDQPLTPPMARWLAAQGLAPYSYSRLRAHDLLPLLPDESHTLLRTSYQQGALRQTVQHEAVIETLLPALARAGVESVLLKGMALAYSVYPNPRCRLMSDMDLWLRPAQLAEALVALAQVGYIVQGEGVGDGPQLEGEVRLVSQQAGSGLVEVQWPALRGEWLRHCAAVDHAAIWARRVPLMLDRQPAHAMSAEDTLLHLCFHQAINHQFTYPCWLRSLLDVHLVVQRQQPDWEEVVARAVAWRLATASWCVLDMARRLMGSPVPERVLAALAPTPARRAAIQRLELDRAVLDMAWPAQRQGRRLLTQFLLVDRPADAAALVGRALFPDEAWLRARYRATTPRTLWQARLLHPWRLVRGGGGKGDAP